MSNTFGNILKISIFGESHSAGIGVIIDGLPAGLKIDEDFIFHEMARRAPGRNSLSTPRLERDLPEIQSGYFNGYTTGTPLCAVIKNTDTRSKDYQPEVLRPSHADYSGKMRYGGFNDYRGGGHFSGRLTAPLVFAGAICKQFLQQQNIEMFAHIQKVKDISDDMFSTCEIDLEQARAIKEKEIPVINDAVIAPMKETILNAKHDGDSVGGIVECVVVGLDAGLGSPFFDSVESRLSSMLFSVPAVKGVEFGLGFEIANLFGSEANDSFYLDGDQIKTSTNHNGGINGGITNGMPVLLRVAIKPTASIAKEQKTVNIDEKKECVMRVHGRHDPCIVQRAVSVVEAVTAIVMTDLVLEGKTYATADS